MIVVPTILFFLLTVSFIAFQRKRALLNPAVLFVAVNGIAYVGTLPLLDSSREADVVYAWVFLGAVFAFILGSVFLIPSRRVSRDRVSQWWQRPLLVQESKVSRLVVWTLIWISIGIGTAYYAAVGYNFFLESILALYRGTDVGDVVSMRLASYSGADKYFAPGYVNQFKNVLMPMLVAYLWVRHRLGIRRLPRIVLVLLGVIAVVSLLGTGQRGPFVLWALGAMVFSVATLSRSDRSLFLGMLVGVTAFFFLLSTLLLARTVDRWKGVHTVSELVTEAAGRVFVTQQESSVEGFRYVYNRPISWGTEWKTSLLGLLPGASDVGLANELAYRRYGDRRGTRPVSIWGSVWHNFGPLGILTIPFLMGLLYQGLYHKLLRGERSLSRLLIFSYGSVILGFWVSGGMDQLLNNGLGAVFGLHLLLNVNVRIPRYNAGQTQAVVPSTGS